MTTPDVLRSIIDQSISGPDLPAVKDPVKELTYAELIGDVALVASGLASRGVGQSDRVALLVANSVDFVVAALASLWVGAAFVPLAVDDPTARQTTIVWDSAPRLVLTADDAHGELRSERRLADSALVPIAALRGSTPTVTEPVPASSRPAYLIYTSGTTGTPKGVQIGTVAFGAAVDATVKAVGLDRSTRTLSVSPFHFDGSYANMFATLYAGGSVVIWPRDALLFPRTFVHLVANEGVTYTSFSPSYLRLLLSSPQMAELDGSALALIAVGGESLSVPDVTSLWTLLPHVRLFNRYGPTETTIVVSHVELTRAMLEDGVIPFGGPHPEVTFFLVDENGVVFEEPERVGELYVGGVQLMDGYWRAADLTSEVLRSDVVPGETLYRTGDLVYRDSKGQYVYVDRADRVIKRSGVRISLVELGETMQRLPHVKAAVATTYDNEGDLGVVAFVMTDESTAPVDLRLGTLELLPASMMPDRIEVVDELPLNRSGKVDELLLLTRAGLRVRRGLVVGMAPDE